MENLLQECKVYIENRGIPRLVRRRTFRMEELSLSEVELYMLENQDASFNEILFMLIDRTGEKDSVIYKRARIDRRLFSKIRSSKKYSPSKKTVIALCLALELSRDDADTLLSSAGYSLSRSDDYDLAISFFISKRIFDFDTINEILYKLGFEVF